jgi:hypothetical protein
VAKRRVSLAAKKDWLMDVNTVLSLRPILIPDYDGDTVLVAHCKDSKEEQAYRYGRWSRGFLAQIPRNMTWLAAQERVIERN